jgi:hydroxyacylglutathione hydrolase
MPEEKCLFSGDTLFYLGCGRVFEGTMDQMWLSLLKLKSLPEDTSVYCGHEYTLSNMKFANYIDTNNALLNKVSLEIKNKRDKGLPTVPFNLGAEKKINPFLKADDHNFIKSVGLSNKRAPETFGEMRLKKDSF